MFRKLFRLIIYVLVLALVCFIMTGVWIVYDGTHDDYDHADIALVPGYTEIKDGVLSPELTARLDRANHLYGMGKFTSILVSGITPDHEDDEAHVMAKYLVSHNVPANIIIEDNRGDTPLTDSVVALMRDRQFHSVLLIDDYFRLTGTKLELAHNGVREIEQAHTGTWKYQDALEVLWEDVAIYKNLYHWYLLPTAAKVTVKATEEEKKLKEKVDSGLDSLHK